MKKTTAILLMMAIFGTVYCQNGFIPRIYNLEKAKKQVFKKGINNYRVGEDTIWYEDFSADEWSATSSNGNPVPGEAPEGYTLVDNTGNGYYWRWSDVGPRGAYSGGCEIPASDPLESTTTENGFLMMEADWYNTTDECTLQDPYIAHDSYVEYSGIDFSEYPSVHLMFQQLGRFCCTIDANSNSFFELSVDGGSTWESIAVSYDDINANNENPNYARINISTIAGGESNVMFRFHLLGLSHYFWMIDDITFVKPFANDLELTDYWSDYMKHPDLDIENIDPENNFYGGFYMQPWYTMHPFVNYRGAISNIGSDDVTNFEYNVDIFRDGEFLVKHSSDLVSIVQTDASDTISVNFSNTADPVESDNYEVLDDTAWKTFQPGYYEEVHYINSGGDQNSTNDTIRREFYIGDTSICYANPNLLTGKTSPHNWTDYIGSGDGIGMELKLPDPHLFDSVSQHPFHYLNSVSTFIPEQTSEAMSLILNGEASIIAKVYKYYEESDSWNNISTSAPYTLSEDNINSWITIPILKDGFSEYVYEDPTLRIILEFYGEYTTDRKRTFEIGEDETSKLPGKYANILWLDGEWGYSTGGPAIKLNMSFNSSLPRGHFQLTVLNDYGMQVKEATLNINGEEYTSYNNGEFEVNLNPGTYNYTITRSCYDEYSGIVTIHTGQTINENVTISGQEHTVTFNLLSETFGTSVIEAQILIMDTVLVTDSLGTASIDLLSNRYVYAIDAPGFYTDYTTTLYFGCSDQNLNIELEEIIYWFDIGVGDEYWEGIPYCEINWDGQSFYTNENGQITIECYYGYHNYSVSHEGYITVDTSVFIDYGTGSHNITLEQQIFEFTFAVIDENSNPLEGATIQINEQTLVTNTEGIATIEIPYGEYTYSVSLNGYEPDSSTVMIDSSGLTQNVILYPQLFNVSFDVVDDGNVSLEGASIQINEQTLMTNSEGFASIELPDGTYTYTVSLDNYGTVSDQLTVEGEDVSVSISLTGLGDLSRSMYTIYPNPTNGLFTIEFNGVYSVNIVNASGQSVLDKKNINGSVNIDLKDEPAGIYFITLLNNNIRSYRKIILE